MERFSPNLIDQINWFLWKLKMVPVHQTIKIKQIFRSYEQSYNLGNYDLPDIPFDKKDVQNLVNTAIYREMFYNRYHKSFPHGFQL